MDANDHIQTLKTQIGNIKLQIDNIELQYNNIQMGNLMNESIIGNQLFNLSIQLLNAGISSFNTGKKLNMNYDNYIDQLNKISVLINSLTEVNNIQPLPIVSPPPMMLNIQNQPFYYNDNSKRKNIIFDDRLGEIINIQIVYGTTIRELINQYFDRLYERNSNNINYKIKFIYDGKTLELNDQRKIEDVFVYNIATIWALKV